jgi:hypothetical protein
MNVQNEVRKSNITTGKMFLHRATGKALASAAGFLQQHREFLLTGEFASVTAPILEKIDAKELMPTPGLQAIRQAVMDHLLFLSVKEHSEKIETIQASVAEVSDVETVEEKDNNPWTVRILNADGNVCTRMTSKGKVEELIKSFPRASAADRWSVLRLLGESVGCVAEMTNHRIPNLKTTMLRDDAVAEYFKKGPSCSCHVKSTSGSALSFRPKVHETRATFSHG